jgi:2-desacetyl-2-hydroxyethyl bacteriochlorophyllide A dehydrogenase
MRVMAVTAYGEPLVQRETPEPKPRPGQVLLRVLTCGVCFTDVKIARGWMPFSPGLGLPHVPGHEVFGEVVTADPTGLVERGSRAIVYQYWPCGRCAACRRGDDVQCTDLVGWLGFAQDGGFSESIAVPADRLILVPPSVDPIGAAPMSCAIGTAYRATITRGGVGPGSRVAVIGLGGVGIHAAQIATVAGGRVSGFDIHEPTLETARELGIEAYRADGEDVPATLHPRSGDAVDVVIDTVGIASSVELADRLVRPGGRIVMVGYTRQGAATLPTARIVLDEIDVQGSRYASRQEMARGVALVAAGLVRPVVGLVRPLGSANEALDALESGDVVGRAVLDVAGIG